MDCEYASVKNWYEDVDEINTQKTWMKQKVINMAFSRKRLMVLNG